MTDFEDKIISSGATVKVKCGPGYYEHMVGKTILKLTNTGNGYIAKFPAYSSTVQDYYVCLDYSQADALYKALGASFEGGNNYAKTSSSHPL